MKKELDEALVKDFPNLYRNRLCSPRLAPICFGFECDDGWHSLIRRLSEKLEKEILKLPEDEREHYWAAQVKEKFGELRFYMSGSNDTMQDIIDSASEESAKTCECCGKPGETKAKHGWLTTLCIECREQGEFPNKG